MGCSPSKVENNEGLSQCKERTKQSIEFMKQSIAAHHGFAAAHFTYATALKNTGTALSNYANGVLQLPEPHIPLLRAPETSIGGGGGGGVVIRSGGDNEKEPQLSSMKENIQNMSLLQLITKINDAFEKASESIQLVSKILEAETLHPHSSSADHPGHTDHSTRGAKQNVSWKGKQVDGNEMDDSAPTEIQSHSTILDKILVCENNLYNEFKAGEETQSRYKRELASLEKFKKRGGSGDLLEQTKERVDSLNSSCLVHMEFINSAVSEIKGLRDEQLYLKLVQLTEEMYISWKNMRKQHKNQSKLLRALGANEIWQSQNVSTQHNFINARQLYVHVKKWGSELQNLIQLQKKYIGSLNNWVKLNVKSIDINASNQLPSPSPSPSQKNPQKARIHSFLHTWKDQLDKLPLERAKTAMNTFVAATDNIIHDQSEEIRMKERCEQTRMEMTKTTQNLCGKHNPGRTLTDEKDEDNTKVMEELKRRLEEEEEEYRRQCVQVNDKLLKNLNTDLPEIVAAMLEISLACSDMYKRLKIQSTCF